MTNTFRRIQRGCLMIAVVFLCSVMGHHQLTGRPILEGAYWTVITVAGVGYSQNIDPATTPARQLLSIAVILVGMVSVAYTLGVLLQAVIEGQLEHAMGARRMIRQIEKLKDHVIICGFGRTGQNLGARLKRQQMPFVVIESNEEAIADAMNNEFIVLEGDATDEEVLRQAGIERAKTIVIALHNDAENVFLTLTARNMNAALRIIARGELIATERKLRQAGANEVVLPAVIGAHRMADMIVRPHAADLLQRVGDLNSSMEAIMAEIFIAEGSPLAGKTIREAGSDVQDRLLIVSVRRINGEEVFNPPADYEFSDGDCLIAMGEPEHIKNFREKFQVG
ncbi:potassium channel family protein [Adhaeretor mobilis]|uniref:Voltage-gated potassium channel Kch n=1 Tax=Adhaeretor mobilis TaxID=1930276 RepID=A0A517MVJ7_9BACT|nr:potassium channel protein [Adhaeretor mobilis]QDS98905.1 Voltage-gated potassium channel Kch [Adhaeretor mobilis]